MTGATSPGPQRRGILGLLGAVGISLLGTRMTLLALPWFVLSTTGDPVWTGLVAAAELTPYVLVQALGGPLVDRLGAWRTAVVADTAAGVVMLAVPVCHAAGALPIGLLMALVAVVGVLRAGGDTARQVLLPGVGALAGLPTERSAGLYDGVNRGAGVVGAPIAGVLIGLFSAIDVLAVDAVTFLASALLTLALVPRGAQPEPVAVEGRVRYSAQLREGFRFLRADRLLLGIGLMVLVTNLLDQAGGAVLIPTWAHEVEHSASALGLISGAFSLGAVAGNVLTTWLGPRLPRRMTYGVGFLMTGGPRFLSLAVAGSLSPVLVVSVLSGLGAGGINPVLGAVEYERVPRHLQARVLGALGATAWAGIPVGSLLGGLLTAAIGVRGALAVAGVVYLVTTVAPFVFPVWGQMDERPAAPVEAEGALIAAR